MNAKVTATANYDLPVKVMKAVRLLVPVVAFSVLALWLGLLYFIGNKDIGAVAIFLFIFAPPGLLGGVLGGVVGNILAKTIKSVVLGPHTGFGNIRYHLLDLIFWSATGLYIGACVGIVTAIVVFALLAVLSFLGLLFLPGVYPASLVAAGIIAAIVALVVDTSVAGDRSLTFEQSVWSPLPYIGLSLLITVPALAGCLTVVAGVGIFVAIYIRALI